MPAGVCVVKENGKKVLVGQLSYFSTNAPLCSVCEDMKWALEDKAWFIEAHEDYLYQIQVKKQLLGQS
ncbi:MAG TPA: hypothetical protein VMF66_02210 [Candidatus Acidoferrum sp.]|nr:hypothetical protein [Candidatus Acidoferrum sp.]